MKYEVTYSGTSINGHLYTTDTSEQRTNILIPKYTMAGMPGMTYKDNQLYVDRSTIHKDQTVSADKRTMLLIQEIGNYIHPSIQLEVHFPSNHEDGKMPILDLKVWTERKKNKTIIMHEFYSKDVSSKAVINAKSAIPWSTKRTVLTQEVLRVLLNCSKELPWSVPTQHVNEMVLRMQYSGYSKKFRYEVVNSALKAYDERMSADESGTRPLYRPKGWETRERAIEKQKKKISWYKTGGDDSVIFVPATPGSELQKRYAKEIKAKGLKIKVVEQAGVPLKRDSCKDQTRLRENFARKMTVWCAVLREKDPVMLMG